MTSSEEFFPFFFHNGRLHHRLTASIVSGTSDSPVFLPDHSSLLHLSIRKLNLIPPEDLRRPDRRRRPWTSASHNVITQPTQASNCEVATAQNSTHTAIWFHYFPTSVVARAWQTDTKVARGSSATFCSNAKTKITRSSA